MLFHVLGPERSLHMDVPVYLPHELTTRVHLTEEAQKARVREWEETGFRLSTIEGDRSRERHGLARV